jgi:hypothetical protein
MEHEMTAVRAVATEHSVADLGRDPMQSMTILAKAQFVSRLLASRLSIGEAMRELGRRMRAMNQGVKDEIDKR